MKQVFFSVSRVNSYIKSILEEDVLLSDLFIQGEIYNFKFHSSGHLYFTLKDENASLSCVMFREAAQSLNFMPQDGTQVMVYGRIGVYEKYGRYQLYVEIMEAKGQGQLYIRFEALKAKLAKEGLFDEANKKPLPENPETLVLITSPTGAAIRDMIKIAKVKNPGVSLVIAPCLVQGDRAAESIASTIKLVNRWGQADVIIVGRGGGSIEDLWAFNEEEVARAIYHSKIPVISAVGHETDFTIADFTADLRASTPSSAIDSVLPDRQYLAENVFLLFNKLNLCMDNKINKSKERIQKQTESKAFSKTFDTAKVYRNELNDAFRRINKEMAVKLEKGQINYRALTARLDSSSPFKIMEKGYALVYTDGKPVKTIEDIEVGDKVNINLSGGVACATIEEIAYKKGEK